MSDSSYKVRGRSEYKRMAQENSVCDGTALCPGGRGGYTEPYVCITIY